MTAITVTLVGTGDAFGSGGRLQTCTLVDGPGIRFAAGSGLLGQHRQSDSADRSSA